MSISLDRSTDGPWRLRGELSFATTPGLLAQSQGLFRDSGEYEIDLAGVERMDSAGLALLVEWLRLARDREARLRYHNLPEQIADLARVCGVDELLCA